MRNNIALSSEPTRVLVNKTGKVLEGGTGNLGMVPVLEGGTGNLGMEVKEVLFMSRGDGENSFAQNSSFTQRVAELSKPVLERTVQSLITEDFPTSKVLNVVDLGCSSGPTLFSVMSTVIENVKIKCGELNCQIPEFQFYLNDLPGNDFNTLFKGLSNFSERYNKDVSCFFMGVPGSFHGRLFPSNSLHLVHSSYAAHWLSKIPNLRDEAGLALNKGKIYISKTSPPAVKEAYLARFQEDFALFLKSRSQEMVRNGRVFLVIHGRPSADFTTRETHYQWEPLAQSIASLVSEGVIEEEKLDSFDVPCYYPSQQEVRDLVEKEGSFTMEVLDTFPIVNGDKNVWQNVEKLSKNIRAFTESMISHHFGMKILDKLYDKFTQIAIQDLATSEEPHKVISFIIVLRRN